MIRDFDFSSASESDSEPGKEPQQEVKIDQNQKRLGILLAGMAVLLAMIAVHRSTISRASDIPPDRSQNVQLDVQDSCFGSDSQPIHNFDSEINPISPKNVRVVISHVTCCHVTWPMYKWLIILS